MLNRREFVQSGVLVAGLAAGGVVSAAVPPALSFYKVVIDERFPQSRAFGTQARRLGTNVLPTRGDITSIWFTDLYYQWKKGPMAIAGLTTDNALFCLDMLARDVGMRVVYRGDHCATSANELTHEAVGPASLVQQVRSLQAHSAWGERAATAVLSCQKDGLRPTPARLGPSFADVSQEQTALVSWIIAPVSRRV